MKDEQELRSKASYESTEHKDFGGELDQQAGLNESEST